MKRAILACAECGGKATYDAGPTLDVAMRLFEAQHQHRIRRLLRRVARSA